MKIETRDFGILEIDTNEIITFKQPIYGFEDLSKYIMLSDNNIGEHFIWLQSVEDKNTCFILSNPELVLSGYHPDVPAEIRKLIGSQTEKDIVYWVITVVPSDFELSTVNLKSPIIMTTASKYAAQIISDDDYPIRMPLINNENVRK